MLHTKFPRNWPIHPLILEKKVLEVFSPYMGIVAILIMWPRSFRGTFFSLKPWRVHMNADFKSVVSEKQMFENVYGQKMQAC